MFFFFSSSAWILRISGTDGVVNKDEIVKMPTLKKTQNDDDDFFPSQERKRDLHTAYQTQDEADQSDGKKRKPSK